MRNVKLLIVACSLGAALTTAAVAQSSQTKAVALRDTRQLLRLMDRDQNGVVTKDEFMSFMSQTFDRLDKNKNGQLEEHELRPLTRPDWYGAPAQPGQF
jgi:Ca2+-binding EF-hand superfamily protein